MVAIANLSDNPEWLDQVADWHHGEWLRHKPARLNKGVNQEDSEKEDQQQKLKRRHVLQAHFGDAAIPSTFVALIDDEPVGSVSVVYYQFSRNQAKSPWLTNVYVRPEFRSRGIAEKLLVHVCDYAKRSGLSSLKLYTYDQENYYLNRGWLKLRTGHLQKRPVSILEKTL